MQVLVLGLPRTGTQSLADALELLGISPVYHMREVGKRGHAELWMAALDAKTNNDKKPDGIIPDGIPEGISSEYTLSTPWTRAQFDQMLGGFQAAADYPAAIFPAELLDAYPEAAVILTVRSDEDAWLSSMSLTLIHHHDASQRSSPTHQHQHQHQQLSPVASLARRYHKACWDDDFAKNGRAMYREHNAKVRRLAVGRSFLEYQPGQGWAPLCEFLGVSVPDGIAYPRSDDWAEYKKKVEEELKASGGASTCE